ncbi:MAG: DUF4380 domain-containing protein [Myxococcota bacterium]|nr:DUF4380 domain-containing protein [Myxococcota bacterium]
MTAAVTREGRCALEFDGLYFEVDPRAGARVTAYRLDGFDVLAGPDVDPANYGSTFWTSPQNDWGWPPPREMDWSPYTVVAEGDNLTFTGPPQAALGVRVVKRFSVDRARRAIVAEYVLQNVTTTPKTYAPWEVSRVHGRGLTFFPVGAQPTGSLQGERREDILWVPYGAAPRTEAGEKLFADGTRGFVAHAGGGHLYVKSFCDTPPEAQAPGEGEIEIYVNKRYVEIEVQGPYLPIAAGASVSLKVAWYLRKLPAGVAAAVGSGALVAFAESVVG